MDDIMLRDHGASSVTDANDNAITQPESSHAARVLAERPRRPSSPWWEGYRSNKTNTDDDERDSSTQNKGGIDEPTSSMSIDVEAVATPNKAQVSGTNSSTSTCGALVAYTDGGSSEPKRLLKFRLPSQTHYSWTPYTCHSTSSSEKKRSDGVGWKQSNESRRAFFNQRTYIRISASSPKRLHERRLRVAAASNNLEQLHRLLDDGVYVNSCDEQGRTPLHLSAGRGYTEMVRVLLKHGANPSLQDCIGNTPLHLAAVTSKIPVVILLLMAGTDPLCSDMHGYNPLQLAQTKLRLLQNCKGGDMLRIKSEVHEVVNLLVAYLKKREGFVQEVDALSSFCSRLSLSNNPTEVHDEVRDLLGNIDSLSLKS